MSPLCFKRYKNKPGVCDVRPSLSPVRKSSNKDLDLFVGCHTHVTNGSHFSPRVKITAFRILVGEGKDWFRPRPSTRDGVSQLNRSGRRWHRFQWLFHELIEILILSVPFGHLFTMSYCSFTNDFIKTTSEVQLSRPVSLRLGLQSSLEPIQWNREVGNFRT